MSTRPGPTAWWNSFTQTARSYRTTLIIIGVAVAILAVAVISARRMLKKADKMGGVNITNFNSNSNPLNNSNNMDGAKANAGAGQPLPALPEPVAAEQEEEKDPEEEVVEELEIWQILRKPVHLRTPAERVAADSWARLHDPWTKDPFGLHH